VAQQVTPDRAVHDAHLPDGGAMPARFRKLCTSQKAATRAHANAAERHRFERRSPPIEPTVGGP
jgi:hypothetical protein